MKIKADYVNEPQWKVLTVKATLPEELKCLDEMAHNMWWVWNHEARDLFRDIDVDLYHKMRHNPVMLLQHLTFQRKEETSSPLKGKAEVVATAAAQKVVGTDHSDTLAMQNAILEAKTLQAEFQVADDTCAINAFNRTFKKYLQEHDPKLAKVMFVERPKDLPAGEPWDEFEQLVEVPEKK